MTAARLALAHGPLCRRARLPAIDECVSGRWPSRAEKITSLERAPK